MTQNRALNEHLSLSTRRLCLKVCLCWMRFSCKITKLDCKSKRKNEVGADVRFWIGMVRQHQGLYILLYTVFTLPGGVEGSFCRTSQASYPVLYYITAIGYVPWAGEGEEVEVKETETKLFGPHIILITSEYKPSKKKNISCHWNLGF